VAIAPHLCHGTTNFAQIDHLIQQCDNRPSRTA
jgi:hypothetical protein